MVLRTARLACFEHESLKAMVDVCPPCNSEGLFDVGEDSWAIAMLYTSLDELEGVQFRDQRSSGWGIRMSGPEIRRCW